MNDTNLSEMIETLSFGHLLKAERLQKGIDLGRISNETKISVKNLMNIEMENHSQLPAEIFVKSYLRSYAAFIGVAGDDVIRRYMDSRTAFKEAYQVEVLLNQSRSKFRSRLLIFICLLLGVILCIIIFTHRSPNTPPTDQPKIHQEIGRQDREEEWDKRQATLVYPLPQMDSEIDENRAEKLLLAVNTLENTWLKIIIDDQSPKEYSLKTQDHLTLEAFKGYNLLIGNGASVQLTLNGKPVNLQGKRGQVVNINLP